MLSLRDECGLFLLSSAPFLAPPRSRLEIAAAFCVLPKPDAK